MIITDLHRKYYSNIYRKRKKCSAIGYNTQNVEVINILDELVEYGYLICKGIEPDMVKIFKEYKEYFYKYYKITDKKLPNKKYTTKKLKYLYTEEGELINIVQCEEPKERKGRWDYYDIFINNKHLDLSLHDKIHYDNINNIEYYVGYFKYFDDRYYRIKIKNYLLNNDIILSTNSKTKQCRLDKLNEILGL